MHGRTWCADAGIQRIEIVPFLFKVEFCVDYDTNQTELPLWISFIAVINLRCSAKTTSMGKFCVILAVIGKRRRHMTR